jgi:tRNA-specific 2-thiouridylase
VKFGALMEYAERQSARLVATGHYARAGYDAASGRHTLSRASDPAKDQSYVLFNLTQEQLSKARFPLGAMRKPDVRAMAQQLGLGTADKPDSQDVCFVRDRNKDGFLRRELGVADEPGPITDVGGRRLGTHRGLLGYTIGQREGLGIAVGQPMYVVALDQTNNRLVVGSRDDILGTALTAERVNWVSMPRPSGPVKAVAKIRSRHEGGAATVTPLEDHKARVEFDVPQQAITPGQAVVFYDGDRLLGGGWISAHDAE